MLLVLQLVTLISKKSLASFSVAFYEVRCIMFGERSKTGASSKNTHSGRLHPCDATPGVFEIIFCDSLFDLTNIFAWNNNFKTRNVYGMYRNILYVIWQSRIQGIDDCKRVLRFSSNVSRVIVFSFWHWEMLFNRMWMVKVAVKYLCFFQNFQLTVLFPKKNKIKQIAIISRDV